MDPNFAINATQKPSRLDRKWPDNSRNWSQLHPPGRWHPGQRGPLLSGPEINEKLSKVGIFLVVFVYFWWISWDFSLIFDALWIIWPRKYQNPARGTRYDRGSVLKGFLDPWVQNEAIRGYISAILGRQSSDNPFVQGDQDSGPRPIGQIFKDKSPWSGLKNFNFSNNHHYYQVAALYLFFGK